MSHYAWIHQPARIGWHSFGVAVPRIQTFRNLDWELQQNGMIVHTETINTRDNYENDDVTSYMEVGINVELNSLNDVRVTVRATGVDPVEILGAASRSPLTEGGVVEQSGLAIHSGPTMYRDGPNLARIAVSPYDQNIWLYDGDALLGKLFSDVSSGNREINDRYHTGASITKTANGWFTAASWHNKRPFGIWAPTLAGLVTTPSTLLASAAEGSTYVRVAVSTDGNTVHLLSRVGPNSFGFELISIEDIEGTWNIVNDKLWTERYYPRSLDVTHVNGNDLITITVQRREGARWSEIAVATWDRDANQWYNTHGDAIGGTITGTLTSPRLDPQNNDPLFGPATTVALEQHPSSTNRYLTGSAVTRIDNWDANDKSQSAFFVFADDTQVNDARFADPDNADFRLAWISGDQQILTQSGLDPLGLKPAKFYRMAALPTWKNNDPSAGIVRLYLVDIGNPDSTSAFEPSIDYDDYYEFGGKGAIRVYDIDLNGVTDSASLAAAVTERAPIANPAALRTVQLRRVGGVPFELIADTEVDELHQSMRAGQIVPIPNMSGDFDASGEHDCDDINMLSLAISGNQDPQFDLNDDGLVDLADVGEWLALAGAANLPSGDPYLQGDADLSGVVDFLDFNIWAANRFTQNPSWCSGDFNASGIIDFLDFNIWAANRFQSSSIGVGPDRTEPEMGDHQSRVSNGTRLFVDRHEGLPGDGHAAMQRMTFVIEPLSLSLFVDDHNVIRSLIQNFGVYQAVDVFARPIRGRLGYESVLCLNRFRIMADSHIVGIGCGSFAVFEQLA